MYLLVVYNFEDSVFNTESKYAEILKELSIPSGIVIFLSTIFSLIVLKCLLNSLDD